MVNTGSFPLAGSSPNWAGTMEDVLNRGLSFSEKITPSLPDEYKFMGPLLGLQYSQQAFNSDPQRLLQAAYALEPLYEQRAQKMNQMQRENLMYGSFIKDVPAAISNAFAQRQRYAPEQIEIAARGSSQTPRYAGSRNYYGFVG